MVSRVYTPLITPYQRPQQNAGNGNAGTVNPDEQRAPAWQPSQPEQQRTPRELGSSGSGLRAVQHSQFQKIPLNDVIHDFNNTMTALGVDETTQQEVATYLGVVRLQASKDQPEVGYIKQTLRTAANTLDQYISKALGQPSKVVKEWVDALLMQDIDYKANITPEEVTPPQSANQSPPSQQADTNPDTTPAVVPPDTPESTGIKTQLKSLIETAKTLQGQQQYLQADEKLQAALDLLQDGNRPDWEGKVWGLRGKILDQGGQWQNALNAYEQAADRFSRAQLPQKQSYALQAAASLLEDHGELQKAKDYYEQVVALDEQTGDPKTLLHSLNDLGSVALKAGDATQAIQALERASRFLQTENIPPAVQSDIQANLAAAYRRTQNYTQAIDTYQQSLKTAKQARDKTRYISGLQQLASLFVEANQPQNAMKAIQRLQQLGNAL
jgi:tetratricopeptide (TPR) repeat protein